MTIYQNLSRSHRSIVDHYADMTTKAQALSLALDHNVTIQPCEKCVHATIGMTCCTVKYSHTKTKDDAALLAVQDCIDAFNKLTGKH